MTASPFEPHRWTAAQLAALRDLMALHPGEPMRLHTFQNAGSDGINVIWVGDEHYTVQEDGRLMDHNGVEVGAEAVV
jgi:hypothetical protein